MGPGGLEPATRRWLSARHRRWSQKGLAFCCEPSGSSPVGLLLLSVQLPRTQICKIRAGCETGSQHPFWSSYRAEARQSQTQGLAYIRFPPSLLRGLWPVWGHRKRVATHQGQLLGRLQELKDTKLRTFNNDVPKQGRRYDVFYNRQRVGSLEIADTSDYTIEEPRVIANLVIRDPRPKGPSRSYSWGRLRPISNCGRGNAKTTERHEF